MQPVLKRSRTGLIAGLCAIILTQLSACASIPKASTSPKLDSFAAIQKNCHYSMARGCDAYDERAMSLEGVLYYPQANTLGIAALYPKDAAVPLHDTAQGWSTDLLRSAIVLDLSDVDVKSRAGLHGLHLRTVTARGTVHNSCVLSAQTQADHITGDSFVPPAPLGTACPSPNQITLYLTDVVLTESSSL